jgi:hypothetical protein
MLQNTGRLALCLAIVGFALPAFGLESTTIIVAQTDAPLKITEYTAAYQASSQYATEGIRHSVKYVSVADRDIVAAQIGLVSFDVWNEFMNRTGGLSMDVMAPGAKSKGTWIAQAYAEFSFHTGVAYVARVRFADGSIWSANMDEILAELRKIEKDFDAAKLKAKPEKP